MRHDVKLQCVHMRNIRKTYVSTSSVDTQVLKEKEGGRKGEMENQHMKNT